MTCLSLRSRILQRKEKYSGFTNEGNVVYYLIVLKSAEVNVWNNMRLRVGIRWLEK